MRTLYPDIEPYLAAHLDVGDGHSIQYDVSGNPEGVPCMFLHGGPGAGCSPRSRRFFDPTFYRIVTFDQRGSGKSQPNAAYDLHGSLVNNTTPKLVDDIEKLRCHLGIEQWGLILGGSWGSTLALAYAQTHPKRCHAILLRGVFLFGHDEVDYFFANGGTAGQHPEAWGGYVSHIHDTSTNWDYEQTDLLGAYWRRLTHKNPLIRSAAAAAFKGYEWSLSTINADPVAVKEKLATPSILIPNATLEVHYMMNHGYLRRGQLLDGVGVMAEHQHVVYIVHGRADYVCQPKAACELVRALHAKGCLVDLEFVTGAGHSDSEPGIIDAIVNSCDRFKDILRSKTTTVGITTTMSSHSIIVRPLVPVDIHKLAPLFGDYLDFYQMKHSSVEELKFIEGRLCANDSTAFGAFVIGDDDKNDDLAGFAICHHTYNSLRLSPSWTLHDLFVTPKYRRRKISSSLLNAVHDHASAAGACEVILSTAHNNIMAQSMYEKHSYVKDVKFSVYSRDLQL